jgi:putative heme iron utilization protein
MTFKDALVKDGIPYTSFEVNDIEIEVKSLKALDVEFRQEPTMAGDVTIAVLDDTCGNLIQIIQRV